MKKKIELEFMCNTSENIIFPRLSTPHGLQEWFADEVENNGKIFGFIWNKTVEEAKLIDIKQNKYVKFKWLESEDEEDTYFGFRIKSFDMTGDIQLIVTDFVEANEEEDAIELWESQINDLKRSIGI